MRKLYKIWEGSANGLRPFFSRSLELIFYYCFCSYVMLYVLISLIMIVFFFLSAYALKLILKSYYHATLIFWFGHCASAVNELSDNACFQNLHPFLI